MGGRSRPARPHQVGARPAACSGWTWAPTCAENGTWSTGWRSALNTMRGPLSSKALPDSVARRGSDPGTWPPRYPCPHPAPYLICLSAHECCAEGRGQGRAGSQLAGATEGRGQEG